MNTRLKFIDIAKGICILFIMYVHIPNEYRIISNGITFHLSTFFVITGMIYSQRELVFNSQIVQKKGKKLMLPYLKLSFFYIFFITVYNIFFDRGQVLNGIIKNFLNFISFNGIGTLWFLPVMFTSTIIFLLINTSIESYYAKIIFFIMNCISIFIVNFFKLPYLYIIFRIFVCTWYIEFGYIIGKKIFMIHNNKRMSIKQLIVIVFLLYFINYFLSIGLHFDLRSLETNNYISSIISPLTGSCMILFAALLVEHFLSNEKFLSFFGENSFIVMATHLEYRIVYITTYLYKYIVNIFDIELVLIYYVIFICLETCVVLIVNNSKLKHLFN